MWHSAIIMGHSLFAINPSGRKKNPLRAEVLKNLLSVRRASRSRVEGSVLSHELISAGSVN